MCGPFAVAAPGADGDNALRGRGSAQEVAVAHREDRPAARAGAAGPGLAVIVPAHRAGATIGPCLDGLLAAGFAAREILVVDDGSPDDGAARACLRGIAVLRNPHPLRPARARNRGAEAVTAEIVVFVDADVVVHADARERVLSHFRADPGLSAVFGSYDDAPPAPALVSRYRNLLHHFVHQVSRPEAVTFWTGFGAVRRAAFLRLGGLDPAWENIEDVEFGLRLSRAGGRIRLDRDMRATHLKAWTLRSMFLTDLRGRARPWTRLMRAGRIAAGELNTAAQHRIGAGSVAVGGASLAGAAAVPELLVLTGASVLAFAAANRGFLAFLARRHGWRFALACMPVHALHYTAALLGYLSVRLFEAPGGTRGRA